MTLGTVTPALAAETETNVQSAACTCTAACTEETRNMDCAVCGAEGAPLTDCAQVNAQDDTNNEQQTANAENGFEYAVNEDGESVTLTKYSGSDTEVIIPSDFDETYQSYADLQARQGFDLEKLKGKRVKQVVYSVTNSEESDVLAELLIYRGKIVAGDICSMKTDGGFTRGLMDRTGQKSNDTKDTSESTSSQADSGAS